MRGSINDIGGNLIFLEVVSYVKHALLWLPGDQKDAYQSKASPNVNERLNHVGDPICHLRPIVCDVGILWVLHICLEVVRIYKVRGHLRENKRAKTVATKSAPGDNTLILREPLPTTDQRDHIAHATAKAVHQAVKGEVGPNRVGQA